MQHTFARHLKKVIDRVDDASLYEFNKYYSNTQEAWMGGFMAGMLNTLEGMDMETDSVWNAIHKTDIAPYPSSETLSA